MSRITIDKESNNTILYIIVIGKDGKEQHMKKPLSYDLNLLKVNI